MKKYYPLIFSITLLALSNKTFAANDSIYEQRRLAYVDTCLAHFNGQAITLQAYKGVPVDPTTLSNVLTGLPTDGTADFNIVQLVRILYLSNGQYDSAILSVLDTLPFWLTKNEVIRDYWSENHMCQWMTSDYLLHEKYHRPIDSRLDYRMRHYLRLKVQYGFYEFLSTVYNPYCLSGLLNLADFAQDPEIKSLATQASQRLLTDMLRTANTIGTSFPTAGRNYYGKYETPYDQNHNNLIYLLTGLGKAPNGASHAGGFLASSTLPVGPVIQSWSPHLDTTLIVGHTLDSGFIINDSLSPADKVIFQWSSGGYFHPECAEATAKLLTDSNLWHHPDFSMFSIFELTPPGQFQSLATSIGYASQSSLICNDTLVIFKDNTVSLSSVQNFWPGKLGFEQMPCMANAGTTAVYTASGPILANFESRPATTENNDLPYVKQKKNVALEMYRPDIGLPTIGFRNPEVSLHWVDSVFDEVRNDSMWLLGRQGNGYVAVRRGCIATVNTLRACLERNGQTWVIMVGDSAMYGSFNNFQSVIDSSKYQEGWTLDSATNTWTYSAQITVDSITVAYDWKGDSSLVNEYTAISNVDGKKSNFNVFPNPAKDMVTVDLSQFTDEPLTLKVVNMLGQELYHETIASGMNGLKTMSTANWADGVYLISAETQSKLVSEMLIKK